MQRPWIRTPYQEPRAGRDGSRDLSELQTVPRASRRSAARAPRIDMRPSILIVSTFFVSAAGCNGTTVEVLSSSPSNDGGTVCMRGPDAGPNLEGGREAA